MKNLNRKKICRFGAYPLLLGLAFGLLACSGAIPHISDSQVAPAEWRGIDLEHGRTVYIANCGACHGLHSPAEHTPNDWKKLFAEMAYKVHLSEQDSTAVIAYLYTASKAFAAH
ncbi:MAG TPA: hypothetical protein VEW28_04550 [Candidatus Kapabacteria bacterium]|nr:hypothetical protein [Candidatus Kapabacteria bacterium]